MTKPIEHGGIRLPIPDETVSYGWEAVDQYLTDALKVIKDLGKTKEDVATLKILIDQAKSVSRSLIKRQAQWLKQTRYNYFDVPPITIPPEAPYMTLSALRELSYFIVKTQTILIPDYYSFEKVKAIWAYVCGADRVQIRDVDLGVLRLLRYVVTAAVSGSLSTDYAELLYDVLTAHYNSCARSNPHDFKSTSDDREILTYVGDEYTYAQQPLQWLKTLTEFSAARFVEHLEGITNSQANDIQSQAVKLAGRCLRALSTKLWNDADKDRRAKEIVGIIAVISFGNFKNCLRYWSPLVTQEGRAELLMATSSLWIEMLIHTPRDILDAVEEWSSATQLGIRPDNAVPAGMIAFCDRVLMTRTPRQVVRVADFDSVRLNFPMSQEYTSGLRELKMTYNDDNE